MKKTWVLLVVLAMLLCAGCHEQIEETLPTETQPIQTEPVTQPTETEPEPTETEPPVPETVEAAVKADGVSVILLTLNRNDVVELVGEYDEDHYIVKAQEKYGLVEKALLRTAEQEPYPSWTGYAYSGAAVYNNLRMQGEAVFNLAMNETVEVLEELGFGYLVAYKDGIYYMRSNTLSKYYIQYSGGGNSGGADGGDIELQQPVINLLNAVPQEGAAVCEATVLADGVELVLCYLNWGEVVQVVVEEGYAESKDNCLTVYMNGLFAYVPTALVRRADEPAYTAWDGYAQYNAELFENLYLLGDPMNRPVVNTVVRVVEELEYCYLVQIGDISGYMAKEMVSVNKVHIDTSGGSGGDWTPPIM